MKSTTFSRMVLQKFVQTVPKMLRLGVFVLVVAVGLNIWLLSRVVADAENMLMDLGGQFFRFPGAAHGEERELTFNGVRVRVMSGTAGAGLDSVLDHYSKRCSQHDGGFGEFARSEISKLEPGQVEQGTILDGVLSQKVGNSGFVTCLDSGEGKRDSWEKLLKSVELFVDSGNLSEVGQMRYVYAQEYDVGDKKETLVVNIWSEGELNIKTMLPASGDAPGSDLPDVPRPEGSRRMISVAELGKPYAFLVYGQEKSADPIASYAAKIEESGWVPLINENADEESMKTYRHFRKGDQVLMIAEAGNHNGEQAISLHVAR